MSGATERARTGAGAGAEVPGTGRPRALIVDRDEGSLAFAAEALNSFRPGFDVATARSLPEAREWLDTFRPDLLLVDQELEASPTELSAGSLLEDPRVRDCKVVVICEPPHAGAPAASESSSAAVLCRPLRLQSLLSAVRDLVRS